MDFLRNLLSRIFSSHSTNDDEPVEVHAPSHMDNSQVFYDEDAEIQRAIEESRREQQERENAKKYESDPNEMDQLEALQYDEIQSVVFNQEELHKILEKLPGVDPDNRIFNEFYY